MKPKHPVQPLVALRGAIRFKENSIVRYLLDNGGIDLNQLAVLPFSKDDQQHFAQLIGYSVSGYNELSYSDPKIGGRAQEKAREMYDQVLRKRMKSR
jgi:hypothetical protein